MARAARSSTIGADESDQKEDVEDAESGIARPRHWLVSSVIIGGESKKSEKARIRKGINILVSTPGRFLDHLRTTRALDVSGVRWVVLDEADRLLDLGFERDLKSIFAYLHGLPDPGRKTPDGKPIVINEGLQPKPLPMPPVPAWTRRRQVILCSATMAKVARLAAWVLKDPLRVSATGQLKSWAKLTSRGDGDDHDGVDGSGSDDDDEDNGEGAGSGPVGLKHEYLVVPLKLKLHALCAYLATMARGAHIQGTPRKIIVFFSTRGAVDFYHAVLAKFFGASDRTDPLLGFQEKLDVRKLHGSMDANERKAAMAGFAGDAAAVAAARAAGVAARRPASKKGKAYDENMPVASGTRGQVLITTDVAARGLDLHGVDLIIQYDAPTDVSEYVHRVGRTARAGRRGAAVLMLAPHEEDFATKILSEKVTMSSIDVTALIGKLLRCARTEGAWEKAAVRQWQIPMEDWVAKDKIARNLAMLGFQAHVKGYATYPSALKPIFHVRKLHLGHLAKSFCLRDAPTDLSQVLGQNQKAAAASAAAAPGGSKDWKANGGARKRVFADGVESYTKTAQALQMRAMASEFNTSMPDRKRRRM
ncbi:P-loop containing nucleoside triphosphate hydrolase protein [Blastocladiella britannica]|nr:P-loop containing nucleoside triphosphate hydrolase protein [Blastocladiella britannica]